MNALPAGSYAMSDDDDVKMTVEKIDASERLYSNMRFVFLVKGIISLIAGIVLLFWPTAGLAVVAVVLGIYLIFDGIERLAGSLRHPANGQRSDITIVIGAVLRIVFGAIILLNPVGSGNFWVTLIFILAGLNLVVSSLVILWKDNSLRGSALMVAATVLMLVLGLLMILLPLVTALVFLRIIAVILVLASVPAITMGIRRS